MNPQRISFARTLPILALLLSYVIIAIPATMAYVNLKRATRHDKDAILHAHQFRIRVPHDRVLRFSLTLAADDTSRTIQAINLPAHFIEFAVGKFNGTQALTWSPFHWDSLAWRALSFPVCCLPFWCLVGVGLDGMLGGRRLRWWSLVPSFTLWSLFLFLVPIYYFAFSASERGSVVYPVWSVWLWLTLLSAFPITLVKQALTRRRIRTSLHARLTAELQ